MYMCLLLYVHSRGICVSPPRPSPKLPPLLPTHLYLSPLFSAAWGQYVISVLSRWDLGLKKPSPYYLAAKWFHSPTFFSLSALSLQFQTHLFNPLMSTKFRHNITGQNYNKDVICFKGIYTKLCSFVFKPFQYSL